jgi:hypothetical protein
MEKEIINNFKKASEKAFELTDKVMITQKNVFGLSKDVNRISEEIANIKNQIMLEISMDVDATGKNVYSNESKRSAELALRLSVNEEYNNKNKVLEGLKFTIRELEIAMQYFKDELSLYKKIMDYNISNQPIVDELKAISKALRQSNAI